MSIVSDLPEPTGELTARIRLLDFELRERVPLDLPAVVRGAIDVAEHHPDAADAAPVEVTAPATLMIEGDPDLLHRAVFNLVINAIQHSPNDQPVRVLVESVPEAGLPPGAEFTAGAKVAIADRGPGIRPEDLPRVFDPFFTTRKGGSGLGLALVHRAVGAHEGLIFVDGVGGRGTTFTMYLPLRLRQVAG